MTVINQFLTIFNNSIEMNAPWLTEQIVTGYVLNTKYEESQYILKYLYNNAQNMLIEQDSEGKTLAYKAASSRRKISLNVIQYLHQVFPDTIWTKTKCGKFPIDIAIYKNNSCITNYLNSTIKWSLENHQFYPKIFCRGIRHMLCIIEVFNKQRYNDKKEYIRGDLWWLILAYLPYDWNYRVIKNN